MRGHHFHQTSWRQRHRKGSTDAEILFHQSCRNHWFRSSILLCGLVKDGVKSPAEIKYDELPFRTWHYFLIHVVRPPSQNWMVAFSAILEDPD